MHPELPDFGQVGPNHRVVRIDGQIVNLEDHSLNSQGERIPNSTSKVGTFAHDINNRGSATDIAPGLAYRRWAMEHAAAAGIDNPVAFVESLYAKHQPSDEAYNTEVGQFRPDFDAVVKKSAFLKVAAEAAGSDADKFAALTKSAKDIGSTSGTLGALLNREAGKKYEEALDKLPRFEPSSNKDFQKRLVDYPLEVHVAVYNEAFRLSLDKLEQEKQAQAW